MKKNIYLKITAYVIIAFTLFSSFVKIGSEDIVGVWLTNGNDAAKIQITKSGETYNGKIIWLKEPNLNEKPKKDIHNPDKSKQNNPIIGLQLLTNFKYNAKENNWENGKIYDPKSGKVYNCTITREGKTLKVRGYIGISLFGRTEVWSKVE